MDRTLSPRVGLVLSLLLGLPALESALMPAPAMAQDSTRDAKAERRVLKANDVDASAQQSAAYREAAHQARLESISRLKEIISNSPASGDQKAEMLLRLADLYFEEGRDLYLDEQGKFQACFDAEFNKPGGSTDNCHQEDFIKESRGWQDKSIKLYNQILTNYPQYARADEATFYLGQALSDTGSPGPANDQFTKLVKTYPQSKFVPDAYVLIGEYWFDQNQALKALTAYQRAAAYKDSEKYAFANYKLAWCYYNVGDSAKSIDTMKAVVAYSMAAQGQVGPDGKPLPNRNIQLQEEALKDLVRFFADAGEMDEAYDYFNKLGKKELIRDMLKRLASTYFEQGKFEQAIQTYRRIIAEDPQGAAAPDFENEIIQALTKMGKKEDTIAEINNLLKNYGKQSAWARANAANQDAVKAAEEFIEKNLRTVAINYHNEAKKLKTGAEAVRTYGLAEQAYEVYLKEFPDSKYSYDVRYSYSELLYTVKKYDIAYDQYMKVVSIDPKGQHSRFCAESAIFAADEMLKKEAKNGAGGPDPGKKTDEIALSDWETKSLAALDQFAKLFPDDEKTNKIVYKSAYLLYNKNHFKEASERFNIVIGKDPKSKEAEQAANLILDSFALVEDWDSLKKNSKFYYDQAGLGSDDFKKEVYGIYENSSLKFIEINFKKSQDKAQGAKDYYAFYQEFPTSSNADLALNNTSVYLHDLGKTGEAVKVRLELINKFPKSKFYKDQVASLGFDYESMANFPEAANWYEKLFALDKTHPGAPDALFSAALFRNSLGQWEQSIKDYQQYITSYPDKPNLNGIRLDIGRTYEEHQKYAEASGVYLTFFTPKPPVRGAPPPDPATQPSLDELMFARLHYGLLMDKLGQGAKVGAHWKETLAFFDKAKTSGAKYELSVEYVAQIMYILAEPQYQAYMAMKVSGPGDKKLPQKQLDKLLTDQLVSKVKAMGEVEKTYSAIISTGAGEWGLASLARLGSAYENLSESLKNSYIPAYLTADQKELYTMALEDKAYPQIEKAAAAYSAALDKSYELNLYNENTANATRRLGVLRPDEYPGLFEKIPDARYASPSNIAGTFETEP
jgi:TolA-binding protein